MDKSKMLFRWMFNERSIISKIYLLALLQGVMYLAIPLGIQGVVTFIMAGSFSASLLLLCTIIVLAVTFIGFFQIWQMRLNETLHEKIFTDIASRIGNFLNDTVPAERIISKLNHFFEVVTLQKGISKILLDFSFSIISIFFGLMILPLYSSWFLVLTLLLGLFFYFIIRYYGKEGMETNLETSNKKYKLIIHFQENSNNPKDGSSDFITRTDEILDMYLTERKKHYRILETQFKGIVIFKILFSAALLFVGAYLVQNGELNIGQFIASEIIIILVINSIEKLIVSLNTCYDIITSLYKIERIFGDQQEYSFFREQKKQLKSTVNIYQRPYPRAIRYFIIAICLSGVVMLFMPWTQNVESNGSVSTLNPENRPQTVTSRISGRVEKWFIRDGDLVNRNDTIAFISEIKEEYIDPQLIERSEQQIASKESAMESYEKKINAVNQQIDALNRSLRLKMEQARNKIIQAKIKVSTDSTEASASTNNYRVSETQLKRYEELLGKGVISRTDVENRRIKVQEALAKKTSADNKFFAAKNEFLNTEIEINSIQQDFAEKLMKADSEKFSVMSALFESEGALTKLQNQLVNYSMRSGFYYVLAPQDGYISKMSIQGIGEIVKEGAPLCSIVPKQNEQVVELYINPIDLPLIRKGQNVQLRFDGWPAFVFSGWPGVSYGTYSAEIVAFDRVLSDNGKFRILAKSSGDPWPDAIQIGSGVKGFALLGNVPLFYELWRQINGFPPEYYVKKDTQMPYEKK